MARMGLFAALAVLINLLLFMLMSGMVQHGRLRVQDLEPVTLVDFIRVPEVPETQPPDRPPPPEPPERLVPQPLPPVLRPTAQRPPPPRLRMPEVNLHLDLEVTALPYLADPLPSPSMPVVISARNLSVVAALPPRYPQSARARRIEGFVELEFTVDRDGGTSDIRVVRADPSGVFERAAERAVSRWKFQPHEVNGKTVAVRARQRMDFRLKTR